MGNFRRLLSPFDLYQTWSHLLDEYSDFPPFPDADLLPSSGNSSETTVKKIPRKFGQSLFKLVPQNRSCSDAGIPSSFCACHVPNRIAVENPDLTRALHFSIDFMNKFLPLDKCAGLTLKKITAAAVMNPNQHRKKLVSHQNETKWEGDGGLIYIVAFIVNPGEFKFEATVNYDGLNGGFSIEGDILRSSSISTDVSCVRDPWLQRYCYCL